MDEARDYIRKHLTHKWVEGNTRAGLQQMNGKRGALQSPIQITRKLNE
jgi:hypothetical protein